MSTVSSLRRRLLGAILLVSLALLLSAGSAARYEAHAQDGARTYRVVHVDGDDVLNIRTGPYGGARIVGAIPPGGRGVELIGDCRTWCPVRYNGVTGWVNGRYLAVEPAVAPFVRRAPSLPGFWQVTGVPANEVLLVRNGPTPQAPVVYVYPPHATCIAFLGGCRKPFCQVQFPSKDGPQSGWVDARFLSPSDEPCG
jgi:uncharacterized protein YraI